MASPLIAFSMARAGALLLVTWVGFGLAGWLLAGLGRNFLPPFDEGSILVNVTLPPGSSLEASTRLSALIDDKFRQALRRRARKPGNRPGVFRVDHQRPGRHALRGRFCGRSSQLVAITARGQGAYASLAARCAALGA
jgi:HME family heavy-metal exporter